MNFVDGGVESQGLIFTGSEGTLEIAGNPESMLRRPVTAIATITSGTSLLRCARAKHQWRTRS